MSRIHDALRKAEEERQFGCSTQEPAILPDNGLLETEDPFALAGQFEGEARIASAPSVAAPVELSSRSFPKSANQGLTPDCNEEFRTLRARLNQARSLRPLKRLLISSALPGEGKTFMAARLAQILAQQKDCRVLLIDGDLRCGTLHDQMEVPASPGVTDFLKGTFDEQAVMYQSGYDGVFVIPSGTQVLQSAELLTSGRLKTLLDRVSNSFDWVIVDSPAATLISDASILSELCDGVILVIEAGATPFDLAQKAKLGFQYAPVVGAVLNRAKAHSKNYYSYYQRSLQQASPTS